MEDYKSPITIIQNDLFNKLEDDVMEVILNYGIDVDKEELIRALDYDRNQYRRGYDTGYQVGFGEAREFYKEYYLEKIRELFKEELDDGEEE